METPSCLDVRHLTAMYDRHVVLRDISFVVPAGAYVGIVGPNGGGKTTLIKTLLGLITPTSGEIRVFGTPLADFREYHHIGYVPQRIAQADFPATVREVVASGRSAKCTGQHLHHAGDTDAITRAMQLAGVDDLADRRIGELSGGQRQRVFIARALAGHPRVLVLDEPTTGVDTASQTQFYELLHRLNVEEKLTILFVSHDVAALTQHASLVLCVNETLQCFTDPTHLTTDPELAKLYGGASLTHHHHSH